MTKRNFLILGDPDFNAAFNLLSSAFAFKEAALVGTCVNERMHRIAIGLELAAKALLAAAGVSTRARRRIGHDLAICFELAERFGLNYAETFQPVIAALHPHFKQGGFQGYLRHPWSEDLLCAATDMLADVVCRTGRLLSPRLSGFVDFRMQSAFDRLSLFDQKLMELALQELSYRQIAICLRIEVSEVIDRFAAALASIDKSLD